MGQQAIAHDDSMPGTHVLMAFIYAGKGQFEQAASEAQRSIALNANNAMGYEALADVMNSTGKPAETLVAAEKAIRLNPLSAGRSQRYLSLLGGAYTQLGRSTMAG